MSFLGMGAIIFREIWANWTFCRIWGLVQNLIGEHTIFGAVFPKGQIHRGETGLANAGDSLSKMDAPKVGKPVFCSSAVFYHNFRASHSPTVFI